MNTIKVKIWDYEVEVSYELTDSSIDILDYEFESEEAADECGLYNDCARWYFEEHLNNAIAEYEARQKEAQKWIAPYLRAKRRRNRDNSASVTTK